MKKRFIDEAKNFFKSKNLVFEYRNNKNGGCPTLSYETEMLLFYDEKSDFSINIHFEKQIYIKAEHLNNYRTLIPYDMNLFHSKLYILLEFIETFKKIYNLANDLNSSKIKIKYKTKILLEKL